ncbi:MAG: DUF308 domain-containing protein [Catenulispora sp.]|nr:DUF308 domain-containing protein [Catenulispora sp.]
MKPPATDARTPLTKLYATRGILAIAWAIAFASNHDTLNGAAITLLIAYPLLDAISSAIDYRTGTTGPERRITAFNGILSTLTAITLGIVAATDTVPGVLATFGAWAIISGAAQVTVGLRRRSPELGKQWPMLIAGGLSFLVGAFYILQATGDKPTLDVLSVYATGGGIFFIAQAGLLAWKTRRGAIQPV